MYPFSMLLYQDTLRTIPVVYGPLKSTGPNCSDQILGILKEFSDFFKEKLLTEMEQKNLFFIRGWDPRDASEPAEEGYTIPLRVTVVPEVTPQGISITRPRPPAYHARSFDVCPIS